MLGLKSLVGGLGDSLSRVIECYRISFLEVWGLSPEHRLNVRKPGGSIFYAASSMAEGQVILILALLSAMIAYLTRGRSELILYSTSKEWQYAEKINNVRHGFPLSRSMVILVAINHLRPLLLFVVILNF